MLCLICPPSDSKDVSVETVAGIASKRPPLLIWSRKQSAGFDYAPYLCGACPRLSAAPPLDIPAQSEDTSPRHVAMGFSAAAQPPCRSRGIPERFFI